MNGEEKLQADLRERGIITTLTEHFDTSDFYITDKVRMEMKERDKRFYDYDSDYVPVNKLNQLKTRQLDGEYDTLYVSKNTDGYFAFWVSDVEPWRHGVAWKGLRTPAYEIPQSEFYDCKDVDGVEKLLRRKLEGIQTPS